MNKSFSLVSSLVLSTGLLLSILGTATASTLLQVKIQSDSLPDYTTTYRGYRVHLTDVQVVKQKEGTLKLAYTAVNTGRQDLQFGKSDMADLSALVVNFDQAFSDTQMKAYQPMIIQQLKKEGFAIVAGKIAPRREMTIAIQQIGNNGAAPAEEVGFSMNIANDSERTTIYYDESTCPDLRIESIRVIKKSKKSVSIEYTVTNIGKGPAYLEGKTGSKEDNVAVKAYMSSSHRLSKGAVVLGGDFMGNLPSEANGFLNPNESHTATIKLDLYNMTKFTPMVILQLDSFEQVRECDETNNKNHIKVRED